MSAPQVRSTAVERYVLLGAVLFLTLGGLLMIFSASSARDFLEAKDSWLHVRNQAVFITLGIGAMLFVSRLPVKLSRTFAWIILGGSDLLLGLVFVMGVGKWGATRWIDLGFTTLQPSEFAKLGCVLVVASIMAARADNPRPLKADLIEGGAAVGIPFLFVMLQPDMGTAMSILLAVFIVLVLGGLQWRTIITSVGAGLIGAVALIFAKPYRAARFFAFLDPESDPLKGGYQILQAKLAFGSGGILGLGLGMSRQKYLYLPAAHTDFVFAIIGEELGLIGALAVLTAFAVLCYAGVRIALTARDSYSRLLAGGLTGMIVTQALINMASVTGLMPVTGVPLPLVSYGGSSLVFTLACVGLILAVGRESDRPARVASGARKGGGGDAGPGERRRNGRPRVSGAGRSGTRRG